MSSRFSSRTCPALQFHVEADVSRMEGWLAGRTVLCMNKWREGAGL